MNITRDILPLTKFKRDTARVIATLKETGAPAVLTVNGRPSVVVMDAEAWQEMRDWDHADTKAAIKRGLADADAGRVVPAEQFFAEWKRE